MRYLVILVLLVSSGCGSREEKQSAIDNPPNIIYLLADDLGYGELGAYGQRLIETPHLDALAAGGMLFTRHYSGAPVCAPARGVLLTGKHTGHAYVRGNDEDGARGDVWDFRAMLADPRLEGQRPLPDSVLTLAEVLREGGYATGLVGKWGLGAPLSEGTPNRQGFDYFYGYNCQRQAHNLYPTHLWENDERVMLDNELMEPHQERVQEPDETDEDFFARFVGTDYAPDRMQAAALAFIARDRDRPFFLYYASPLPHLPLQAPQRWIDHYRAKFGEEAESYRGKGYFPCRYPRATYAAMISTLDEQVGQLVAKLKSTGQYDNTLIVFSSDNGPTYTGGADTEFFDSAQPFRTDYGRGKGFVYEGGIRVPMIVHWPGTVAAGSRSGHPSAFQDVFPTLAAVAGIRVPAGLDGISFLPELKGAPQPPHEELYWEFPAYGGQQALQRDGWKLIRKELQKDQPVIELYRLTADSTETENLAAVHPDIVADLTARMDAAHSVSPVPKFRFRALGEQP